MIISMSDINCHNEHVEPKLIVVIQKLILPVMPVLCSMPVHTYYANN